MTRRDRHRFFALTGTVVLVLAACVVDLMTAATARADSMPEPSANGLLQGWTPWILLGAGVAVALLVALVVWVLVKIVRAR